METETHGGEVDAATTVAAPAKAAEYQGAAPGDTTSEVEYALQFELLRNALYHEARSSWYAGINRAILFLSVILGSGAIAAFGADFPIVGQLAGLLIAVTTAAGAVFDFSGQAANHAQLRRRFYQLAGEFSAGATSASIIAQLPLLYADEPPMMRAVNAIAHNAAGLSLKGDEFKRTKVSGREYLLRHVLPFSRSEFPKIEG